MCSTAVRTSTTTGPSWANARSTTPGGIYTPAAAMGDALIDRLQARAVLRFQVEDEVKQVRAGPLPPDYQTA